MRKHGGYAEDLANQIIADVRLDPLFPSVIYYQRITTALEILRPNMPCEIAEEH
jgi:hypothetical protein